MGRDMGKNNSKDEAGEARQARHDPADRGSRAGNAEVEQKNTYSITTQSHLPIAKKNFC